MSTGSSAPSTEGASIDNEAIWNRLDTEHPCIGPVDAQAIDMLLRAARLGPGARILDVGCGLGAWVLRALELYPDACGVGADLSAAHLAKARADAERRGLAERFTTRAGDAGDLTDPEGYDLILCIGLSESFGGPRAALEKLLRPLLRPGGTVLLGEPFWQRPPDAAALAALTVAADRYPDFDGVMDSVTAAGWVPLTAHVSTTGEWDAFMWACVRALTGWGLNARDPADKARILRFMADYRDAWLQGYREVLGFATLLLRPVPLPAAVLAARRPSWAPSPWRTTG